MSQEYTPEFIALALGHSRNFASANPRLSKTTVEHIEALCNIVENLAKRLGQPARLGDTTCPWCEGDGYLPGESPAKRCRYCNGRTTAFVPFTTGAGHE